MVEYRTVPFPETRLTLKVAPQVIFYPFVVKSVQLYHGCTKLPDAALIHPLQYLASDVMPIVIPTFHVLFLMLQHRLCFPHSLVLAEREAFT